MKQMQKKIRNATPTEFDGIKFRSKLEVYTYKKLKEACIDAEYEKHRYELLPAFTYYDKKYRAMTYLPDFVGSNFIIECKGFANDAWPLREKLFKHFLVTNNIDIPFYKVSNQKEVDNLIKILKNDNN